MSLDQPRATPTCTKGCRMPCSYTQAVHYETEHDTMTEKEEATVRPLSALPPLRAVATGSQKRRGGVRW